MDETAFSQIQSRRRFLEQTACGLGGMALWQLMADEARAKPHFTPRAKNVIFLFMPGAPSQLDLLDPKPMMKKYHGQPVPAHMTDGLDDALIRGSARVFAVRALLNDTAKTGWRIQITFRTSAKSPTTPASSARCTPTCPTTRPASC